MKKRLAAGFGEADITPDGRIAELCGQYYRRVSEGVHSRLKAVALYLEQGERKMVMASLDVAGVPEKFCEKATKRIAEKLGRDSSVEVILNATHTHNAPALIWFRDWWELAPGAITEDEFGELAASKVAEAAEAARGNRKNAGIACRTGYSCAGHPRRALYHDGRADMYGDTSRNDFAGMEGGEDSGAEFMFFFDEEGKPFGAVVNVACPSQVMEATRVISSDYMGALREKLKNEYGEGFKTVCQVSAAGCQSPRDLARNVPSAADFWGGKGVEIISERLLNTASGCLGSVGKDIDFEPDLMYENARIPLPVRTVSYGVYLAALGEKERLSKIMGSGPAYEDFCEEIKRNESTPGRLPPYDDKSHHFVRIRQQEAVISRYEEQFVSPFVIIDLHCLRLGQALLVTNPFELFLEYGRMIKARSRAETTFVIQLANGSCGYLPTEAAELHGGYGALVMNGKAGSEGGRKLVEDTLAMSETLFRKN